MHGIVRCNIAGEIMTQKSCLNKWLLLIGLNALLIAAPVGTSSSQTLFPDGLDAKDIIIHMADTYAESRSYSDTGVVEIVFIRPDSRETKVLSFTTAFIRPDRFRFEYNERKPNATYYRHVIFQNDNEIQTHLDMYGEVRKPESLNFAIAESAGISFGSAQTVPAMLLPGEITWRRAIRYNEPVRIEDDKFDDADCFRIQDIIIGNPTTFWIDKQTYMIRKIYLEQNFEDFRTEVTTTYKPVMNGEVMDQMLEFNPPG